MAANIGRGIDAKKDSNFPETDISQKIIKLTKMKIHAYLISLKLRL